MYNTFVYWNSGLAVERFSYYLKFFMHSQENLVYILIHNLLYGLTVYFLRCSLPVSVTMSPEILRDFNLHTVVVPSDHLRSCCFSVVSIQSALYPLNPDNKVFSSQQMQFTEHSVFLGPACVNLWGSGLAPTTTALSVTSSSILILSFHFCNSAPTMSKCRGHVIGNINYFVLSSNWTFSFFFFFYQINARNNKFFKYLRYYILNHWSSIVPAIYQMQLEKKIKKSRALHGFHIWFLWHWLSGVCPQKRSQPKDVHVKAGDMAVLSCPLVKQNHVDATVKWTSHAPWGPNLNSDMTPAEQMQAGVLVHRGNLAILSVSQHHQGNYSCSVR